MEIVVRVCTERYIERHVTVLSVAVLRVWSCLSSVKKGRRDGSAQDRSLKAARPDVSFVARRWL